MGLNFLSFKNKIVRFLYSLRSIYYLTFYYISIEKGRYRDIDLVSQLGMEKAETLQLFLDDLFQGRRLLFSSFKHSGFIHCP